MKPLNLDNSPCSPVSSNCVIWAGPNIPCIALCAGDTISDVTFKLATELCTILDYLNVDNYDLSCFNLASCQPNNFQELLQFLINRICALENIESGSIVTTTVGVSTRFTGVTDYLMTAAPCFGGGTVALVDYIDQIANRICSIITDIAIINSGINSLDIRVTTLENAPVPSFVIPSFILQCNIGTIIPVLAAGSTQDIDVVVSRFINEEWCPYKAVLDTSTNISNAITSQCILGTDDSEALKYSSPGTQMQVAYPAYVSAPTTLAQAINNLWIALCDVRNAGNELVTVTAGNNVTVTTTTTVVGADEVTDYTIDALDTVVTAGDNITITSVTSPTNVTTYTINGKESIVVGADDIIVTPVTVGNDTTYTISRPKLNFYQEANGTVNVTADPVADPTIYHFPVGYNALTYTNTSGSTKSFTAHVSYLAVIGPTAIVDDNKFYNALDGAIVTTAFAVDTVEYASTAGRIQVLASLYDGPTNADVVNIGTAEQVVTTPSSNPVEFRFSIIDLSHQISFFKVITLNNGESVSLKFRTSDPLQGAYITQAQLLVQEL
jgi:hypothetical protein